MHISPSEPLSSCSIYIIMKLSAQKIYNHIKLEKKKCTSVLQSLYHHVESLYITMELSAQKIHKHIKLQTRQCIISSSQPLLSCSIYIKMKLSVEKIQNHIKLQTKQCTSVFQNLSQHVESV